MELVEGVEPNEVFTMVEEAAVPGSRGGAPGTPGGLFSLPVMLAADSSVTGVIFAAELDFCSALAGRTADCVVIVRAAVGGAVTLLTIWLDCCSCVSLGLAAASGAVDTVGVVAGFLTALEPAPLNGDTDVFIGITVIGRLSGLGLGGAGAGADFTAVIVVVFGSVCVLPSPDCLASAFSGLILICELTLLTVAGEGFAIALAAPLPTAEVVTMVGGCVTLTTEVGAGGGGGVGCCGLVVMEIPLFAGLVVIGVVVVVAAVR